MLTDYHVHLRPDEPGTTAESFLTAENAAQYRAAANERGIAELGVSEHIYRFTQALELWTHPLWQQEAQDDVDAYCEFVREETDLKLGIEADFLPGREDRVAAWLEARPFDYVVGSVHFLADQAVDHPGYDIWSTSGDPDRIWKRYFEAVAEAARSGAFDVLAHPDLVKVWGSERPAPNGDLRRFYEPLVEAVAETGIAVEISTAGLRKPIGEIYPAPQLLEQLVEAGANFALSSDAHRPEDLGFGYPQAVELLRSVGIEQICVFERRQRSTVPLG